MITKTNKNANRKKRHNRVRTKVTGTAERPRLNVYRSLNHIYVQIIDDVNGTTLTSASSLDPDLKQAAGNKTKKEVAKLVGEAAAKKALEKGIKQVVFDRGGYIYHGRVLEVAAGAREAGLEF
ncbi:MAG: 50S ribosomal protein L18 [Caldicoprobacterales bacterium]|nr:50S ribosomal protein L18 [Clostridia bacterium]MDI9511530.1 50S ribosomal protein L18 [Bacillota bacterium]NLH58308.1 50S ribosomal protein L18 [Clostridiales bacterium]